MHTCDYDEKLKKNLTGLLTWYAWHASHVIKGMTVGGGGGVEIKLANFPDDKSHLTVFNVTNLFIQTIGKGVDLERSFADTKK